jgi:hypothetical protein
MTRRLGRAAAGTLNGEGPSSAKLAFPLGMVQDGGRLGRRRGPAPVGNGH